MRAAHCRACAECRNSVHEVCRLSSKRRPRWLDWVLACCVRPGDEATGSQPLAPSKCVLDVAARDDDCPSGGQHHWNDQQQHDVERCGVALRSAGRRGLGQWRRLDDSGRRAGAHGRRCKLYAEARVASSYRNRRQPDRHHIGREQAGAGRLAPMATHGRHQQCANRAEPCADVLRQRLGGRRLLTGHQQLYIPKPQWCGDQC